MVGGRDYEDAAQCADAITSRDGDVVPHKPNAQELLIS